MKDLIEYFKTMITPPVEDALVIVGEPSEIDYSNLRKKCGEDKIVDLYEPLVHGFILLDEPTQEESQKIMDCLKSGGHVIMIPKDDIGYKGVITLEDLGFEVRDSIFVADSSDGFYYQPKPSQSEKEGGLDSSKGKKGNVHPTVKPIGIMEWCARDLKPNSKVVDPFLGSGTTGVAMSRLGHDFIGVELQPLYAEICTKRIKHWSPIGTEIKSESKVEKTTDKKDGMVSIF